MPQQKRVKPQKALIRFLKTIIATMRAITMTADTIKNTTIQKN